MKCEKIKMPGIDLGVSSVRGMIGSFDGEKLEIKENHLFLNEPVIQNGRFSRVMDLGCFCL